MTADAIALYIDPPSHHFLDDKLFRVEGNTYAGDHILAPYAAIRAFFEARGVPVHTSDHLAKEPDGRRNFVISFGMRNRVEEWATRPDVVLSAFFAMECPIVEPQMYRALPDLQRHYKRLFSWSDSAALRPVTNADLKLESFYWPQSFDQVHDALWSRQDRRFMVMMNSNKLPALRWSELYTHRLRAMEYFAKFDEIDLYGRGWDGAPFRIAYGPLPGTVQYILRQSEGLWLDVFPNRTRKAVKRCWRGAADSKSETMSQYRFAICFENSLLKGWITEKIFDCFFAGVVPIYWGDPDITESIPASAFIDMREFGSYEQLRAFLKGLSPEAIEHYRESGRAFIGSDHFERFSKATFVEIMRRVIEADSGLRFAA
jgi:hypothetical protein